MARILRPSVIDIKESMQPRALITVGDTEYIAVGRVFSSPNKAYITRRTWGGRVVWEKTLDAEFDVMLESIAQLKDGSLVAVGSYFYSIYSGDEYIWIVKLDDKGEVLLEMKLGAKDDQNDGNDVIATPDGGFVVASTVIIGGSGEADTWIVKYNKDFEQEWERTIQNTTLHCVKQTQNGGYVFSGAKIIAGSSYDCNVVALHLDADGNTVWERVFDDISIYVLHKSEIIEDRDGNFVIAAKTNILKLDKDGQVIWVRTDNAFRLTAVALMPDGSYGFGGGIVTYDDVVYAYVIVIDKNGEKVIWDNSEPAQGSFISDVLVDGAGFLTCAESIMDCIVIAPFEAPSI